MKKKCKQILIIIAIFILSILIKTNVKAASTHISANTTEPKPGETVTVTGSVTAGAWNLTLSAAGQSQTIYGYTNTNANASDSKSISFVAGDAGTTYKVTLTGDMTDISASNSELVNKNITITVAEVINETPEEQTPPQETTPQVPSTDNNSSNTNNNQQTPPEETKKSSNSNLSNLGIRPNDFTGFKSGTTSYNVTVPNDVKQVEVYAVTQDDKATISGTGNKTLQEGDNSLSVVVTAEDGTTKTYTINVTREVAKEDEEEKEEETEEEEEEQKEEILENTDKSNGLSKLEIAGATLEPEFKTNVYEYKVKYIGEETELEITAEATDEKYVVDVTGNENLKEGENIITILVSDKESNNIATYQVTVEKSLVDEAAILREQEEQRKQEEKQKKMIFSAIIAVAVIAIIIYFIIRHRRNRSYAEEYSGVTYSNLSEEADWQNETEYEENDEWKQSKLSKKELKKKYLEGYEEEQELDNFYEEEEEPIRIKHRGKRFK